MVVMIISALMTKEICERVDIVVWPVSSQKGEGCKHNRGAAVQVVSENVPETIVKAPALKDAYPHALQTFRNNKCECKPNSLWARMANTREMPCQYASSLTEMERQNGSSTQRRFRAPSMDMSPVGIGLHGLFDESSSGSRL